MVELGFEPGSPTGPPDTESYTRAIQISLRGCCHQETPGNKGAFLFSVWQQKQACFHRRALACGSRTWASLSLETCLWWLQRVWAQSLARQLSVFTMESHSHPSHWGADSCVTLKPSQCLGCRGCPHRRRVGCQTPQPEGTVNLEVL